MDHLLLVEMTQTLREHIRNAHAHLKQQNLLELFYKNKTPL